MPEPIISATPENIRRYVETGRLHKLVKCNPSVEDVQALLDKYPNKVEDEHCVRGDLPLHNAAGYNASVEVINLLLKENKSAAEKKNKDGDLPLHLAGRINVVKVLLDAYPEGVKAKDNEGRLPLHFALYNKYELDVVKALLDAHPEGAKAQNNDGELPLHFALYKKHELDVVKALLDAHPEGVKAKDNEGRLPLHTALRGKCGLYVVRTLIDAYPEGVKEKDDMGDLPLHTAMVGKCGLGVVKALLDAYPEGVKVTNIEGNLPLHHAMSENCELDIVKALLDAYPDGAKEKNEKGRLPLHLAFELKREHDVVKALFDAYPEGVKAADSEGKLPLHISFQHDVEPNIIREVYSKYREGSKAKDNYWNLPVHIAAQYYKRDDGLIRHLLGWYSEGVKATNNEGKLPLQVAIEHEREAVIVEWLLKKYPEGVRTLGELGKKSFENAIDKEYPEDVVFALLQEDMPLDNDGNFIEHTGSWFVCVASDKDAAVGAVGRILSNDGGDFGKHIHALVDFRDARGRQALGLASDKSLSVINMYLLFCHRYKLNMGSPEHQTPTSLLVCALDLDDKTDYGNVFDAAVTDRSGKLDREELQNVATSIGLNPELFLKGSREGEFINKDKFVSICKQQLGDGPRKVVIKFMRKEHWQRERNARENHNLSPQYVVSALPNIPSVEEFEEAVRERKGGLDTIAEKYLKDIQIGTHAIVMDAADRNLHQIFYQEQPKIGAVREILKQVFEAVDHLHEKKLMHGDLKMLNIVRMRAENRICLIDFDASAEIVQPGEDGESYAGAKFSSAVLPPEMIGILKAEDVEKFNDYWKTEEDEGLKDRIEPKVHKELGIEGRYVVKSFRTERGEPVFEGLPYELVDASENIDAWSLGVLAFTLLTGEPLIPSTRDDDCASGAAMHLLYTWGNNPGVLLDRYKKISNKAARDLVKQLLEREPEKRPSIGELLENHAFFNPADEILVNSINEMNDKVMKKLEEMDANILVIKDLTSASKYELAHTCEVLLKAIYEATEVKMPTCFIILPSKLPEPTTAEKEAKKELLDHFAAKADGSGVEFTSKYASVSVTAEGTDIDINLPDEIEKYKEQVDTGMKWIKRIKKIGSKVAAGEVGSAFDVIKKEIIQEQLVGNKMYFYLVDQLTGDPVQEPPYPLEITSPSDLVSRLLPLMQVGMRAMSIYNGTAGIARMFGFPFPKVPKEWSKGSQESIEMLKKKSSVEEFGVLQNEVEGGKGESKTVRGAPLRDFMVFMENNDPGLMEKKNGHFAGLQRIGDPEDGTALWTKLTDPADIEKALKERSRQRREEELKQAQFEHGQAREEIFETPVKNDESTESSMTNEENVIEPTIESGSAEHNETGNEEVETTNESTRVSPADATSEVATPVTNVYNNNIHCCDCACNIM